MKNKITHFKTKEEVSDYFYTLCANIISCCDNELNILKNERSDASYQYSLYCPKCKKILYKINWDNKVINNIYY